MKYFLAFLLFANICLAYTPANISFNDYQYNRWVKPQLKSITQDYQTLLMILNPELKVLKEGFKLIRKIDIKTFELKDICYITKSKSCFPEIEELIDLVKDLKLSVYNKVNYDNIKNLTIDEKTKSQLRFTSLYQQMTAVENKLENFLIEGKILSPKQLNTKELKHQLSYISTLFDLFILETSDNRFQNDFNTYWASVIKPVTINILIKNNRQYFIDNINDLNIRWNSLNVVLTKRNFEVPKQALTLLNIMHNRWKNILKVVLVTNPKK